MLAITANGSSAAIGVVQVTPPPVGPLGAVAGDWVEGRYFIVLRVNSTGRLPIVRQSLGIVLSKLQSVTALTRSTFPSGAEDGLSAPVQSKYPIASRTTNTAAAERMAISVVVLAGGAAVPPCSAS